MLIEVMYRNIQMRERERERETSSWFFQVFLVDSVNNKVRNRDKDRERDSERERKTDRQRKTEKETDRLTDSG